MTRFIPNVNFLLWLGNDRIASSKLCHPFLIKMFLVFDFDIKLFKKSLLIKMFYKPRKARLKFPANSRVFITYEDSATVVIYFVFSLWIVNELLRISTL